MKTIFFDWGGVIADDPGDDFLMQLLTDIGASQDQINNIMKSHMSDFMRGKISEQGYWNALKENFGLLIHDSITDEFKKWSGLQANEEVLALVSEAKEKGWQTAILSNVIPPTYSVLKEAGFYEKFDGIIASCEVGFAKPDQEIYDIALDTLRTSAHESVFIDDKQKNLDPAKKMGFKVILAENPTQIIRDIKAVIQ